jgi:uncharacterized membrane protein
VHDFFQRRMAEGQGSKPGIYRDFRLARDLSYSAVWLVYGASVMVLGFLKRESVLRWQALLIIGITIGKVFLYDVAQLRQGYRIVSFIALGAVLMFISFIYQRDWLQLQKGAAAAGRER